MSKRIGVLSGTFDPVHNGHINFALAAIRECNLDEVVFLVERNPRRKKQVTPYAYRTEMVELALAPHMNLRFLELPEDQFTVEKTLSSLKKRLGNFEAWLLVGSDVFFYIPEWPGAGLLADTARFAIGLRTHPPKLDVEEVVEELKSQGIVLRHKLIETTMPDLSSSYIRKQFALGKKPAEIPPAVQNYVAANGIYFSRTS